MGVEKGRVVACGKYPSLGTVEVTVLEGEEAEGVARGYYEKLDANTLYMRFMAVVKDLGSVISRMVSRGCLFLPAWKDGQVIGLGELCWSSEEGCLGALSVRPEYRRRGVGSVLLLSMLCLCSSLGGDRLVGEVLVFNDVALRFFKRVGGVVEYVEEGVVKGFIPVSRGIALVSMMLADRGVSASCKRCEG